MIVAFFPRPLPIFNTILFVEAESFPTIILQEFFCIGLAVPVEVADGVGVVEVC